MSFDTGSMSFQRYKVVGDASHFIFGRVPTAELLDKLEAGQFRATDLGVPPESEWGWCGPRHVLDADFSFETCVYNECVFIGLRIDTNKVPASIKQAYQQIEEQAVAAGNPSGFISKAQKRECKDTVARQIEQEMRDGKYRRSKLITLLWDVPAGIVYGPSSVAARDKLQEIFSRTFELELMPMTSGHIALRDLEKAGKRRDYEDFMPTRFAKSAEDPDMNAEYPWTAKGDGAKDFLGNEFLLWLWFQTHKSGVLNLSDGQTATVMFDRSLQLDCCFGQTGKDGLVATGPTRLPEAFEAVRTGKVPRRAGLIVNIAAGGFDLALTGDSLAVSSLKLPEIEKADTARTLFEERIMLLRDFGSALDGMFSLFLQGRSVGWSQTKDAIGKWAKTGYVPNQAYAPEAK